MLHAFLIVVLASTWASADAGVTVHTKGATEHDRVLLEKVARSLESTHLRATKTFRVYTYRTGGVRGLTELDNTGDSHRGKDRVVLCKRVRHALWRLSAKATAPRTFKVTFSFEPR